MAEVPNYTAADLEGMDDLGSLPRQTIAIKNNHNGLITRQDEYLYEGGPGMEGWEQVIRNAVAHSKDYTLLESLDGEKSKHVVESRYTMQDGSEYTLAKIEKLHPKTREALAIKTCGFLASEIKGKGMKEVSEMVFARLNTLNSEALEGAD